MGLIKNDPDKEFPSFYIACGLGDDLLEANRSIRTVITTFLLKKTLNLVTWGIRGGRKYGYLEET